MNLFLCFIMVTFESLFLLKLLNKHKLNSITIAYIISFFYCNSIFFDGLMFSESFLKVHPPFDFAIDLKSVFFLKVKFLYFIFFLSFFILFRKKKKEKRKREFIFRVNKKIVIASTLIFSYFVYKSFGLTRKEIVLNTYLIEFILINLATIYWALCFLNQKMNYKLILFSLVFLMYGVFSFQREPILLLLILILTKYKVYFSKRIVKLSLFSLLIITLLLFWKAFYVYIIQDFNLTLFFDYVKNKEIYLSNIDPLPSFSLIYDYFRNSPSFYDNYELSYFNSLIDFFNQILTGQKAQSLGRTASDYYTDSKYGVAFSMILESFLNFGYFGGIIIALMVRFSYDLMDHFSKGFDNLKEIFFIILFTSLVRTEFIVIFKIVIIPFILFVILMRFNKLIER